MTLAARLSKMVQTCYDLARARQTQTRDIAAELVATTTPRLRDEMAVEWLVSAVSKEQRAVTLAVERSATSRVAEAADQRRPEAERLQEWRSSAAYKQRVREAAAEQEAADERHLARMKQIIDDYTASLKVQWTEELLASTFALSGGVVVTWGTATLEQHQERYDMFAGYAQANAGGAARHAQAIQELTRTGAVSLNDTVAKAGV